MALDFKTMSLEKKVTFISAVAIVAFSLIAFIVCLTVPSTQEASREALSKATKNLSITDALRGNIPNIYSGINWTLCLGFFSCLAVAAIYYFKGLKTSIIPESVPLKFVVPGVVVLTALFAWIYLSVGMGLMGPTGWMINKGTFWAILLILFTLAFICLFCLAVLEKKDNLMAALPECALVLAGIFMLLATIGALAFGEESESFTLVKISLAFNALFVMAFGCLTLLKAVKDEE